MTFAPVFVFVLCTVLEAAESLLSGKSCNQPLGIADGKITDERMSASSAYNDDVSTYGAHRGRLKLASWPPGYRASPSHIIGNNSLWIQIDFQKEMAVTGIATQGYGDSSVQEWVETYTVKYQGSRRLIEVKKVFTGNTDSHSVQRHDFPKPLETSKIILLPQTWNNNFALRMELYGCEPKYNFTVKLLVRNIAFTFDVANTSSSLHHSLKTNATNEICGMLNGSSGFTSADFNRFGPYTLPLQLQQAHSSVIVEMNIQHQKNFMTALLDKLKTEVGTGRTMFDRRVVEAQVPFNYTCSPPTVSVNLNKAMDQADVLLATDKIAFQAVVNHTSCSNSTLSRTSWEISRGSLRTKVFNNFLKRPLNDNKPEYLLRHRYSRPNFFYVSCVLRRPSDGRVLAYDYGYILLLQPQPVVDLTGPERGIKGQGVVLLNATVSVDSHPGSRPTHFSFSWYCRRIDELFPEGGSRRVDIPNKRFNGSGGCYGYGPGQLSANNHPSLSVDLNKMEAGKTYVFRVVVASSQYRPSSADHHIIVLQPTTFSIRCTYNCGPRVSTNKRMIIQSECAGPLCQMITRYEWSMYYMNQSNETHHWERVANLNEMILSQPISPNFLLVVVINSEHALEPGTFYRIHLEAFVKADTVNQDDIMFETNSPPLPPHTDIPGGCKLTPREGMALSTDFLVNCSSWHDEDLPLSFSYSYKTGQRIIAIKRGTHEPTLTTILPQGEYAEDYNITIQVEIFDRLGSASVDLSTVRVLPDNRFPSDNVDHVIDMLNTSLKDSVIGEYVDHAATKAVFFLTSVQHANAPQNDKDQVKNAVLAQMANVQVKSFFEVEQLSSVVTLATDEREDMSITSLENTVELLTSMTDFIWANVGGIHDYDKDAVQKVGGDVLHGFSNAIVASSSQAAKTKEQNGQRREMDRIGNIRKTANNGVNKARDLTQNTLSLIDKLGSALLSTKVLGEKPTTFTSDAITMILDRQRPSEMAGKTFRGEGKMDGEVVRLPSAESLFGNNRSNFASVDAQILLLKENPYTWDQSSENISSSVIQFDLKTGNETTLNISGLQDPLQLFLPIKQQTNGSNKTPKGHLFVKPNGPLQVHQLYLGNDAETAFVELRPQTNAIFEVFVSSGARPTPEKHNFTRAIPDFSSCTPHGAKLGDLNCTSDPYMFSFSSTLTGRKGLHFIGIRLFINLTESPTGKQPRTRRGVGRSCGDGNGRREKRSCIGVKEPPTTPPPTPTLIIPEYNASSDVNYTMSVTAARCLYWSEKKQAWTSEGCQAGPKTNSSRLHCLCTHLSAFGGNIFVAPNPIDFDRVWKEFARLPETKNYVVIFTICSIFGLYFIGVTFAHRADKKDHQKVVANVLMSDGDTDGYKYNVSIQTGMWSGFGTTAKVGMLISGENGDSGVISLSCLGTTRKLFARASVNNFTLSLPKSLGKLTSVDVWHDNSGRHPAWFLQQIVVTDEQTEETWFFFVNQWLAVDKGAGEIEISVKVAEGKDLTAFKPLFIWRASRRLGEEHIWISVFSKPPHNPFTRCQRLSCCLSFLFTAMVTNAMFYQFGREATDTFKFGPLVMSWTQIKIGIQSSMIAIPVNVLVVLIFRNVKQSSSPDIYNARDKSTVTGCLPHFFVYIGWLLCLLVSLTGAFFTVLYSLQWGAVVSNEWLTSILVSLVQDVLVTQPIKVIAFATLLSLVIKKPPEQDIVIGPSFFEHGRKKSQVKSSVLRGEKLVTTREYSLNLRKAFEATKELISFLVFGFLLLVICYGDQDPARYHVTKSLNDIFGDIDEVVDTPSLWNWINEVLVPGLYDVTWYNGRPFEYDEGFISSREGMMLGMPRLRQIRIRAMSKCPSDILDLHLGRAFSRCLPAYSSSEEDKTRFNLPRWISLTNYSDPRFPIELCPKPWRYVAKHVTQSLSHQGVIETYDGGGYVADLGYNEQSAVEVTGDLRTHDWIDDLTAAVFIEFTVFNPSSSLFSVVRGVYERLRTGAAVALVDVKTFALYPSSDVRFQSFYEVCQLLFLIVIVVCFVAEMVKFIREKRYLHQLWNWVELALLVVSLVAVVMSFLKGKYISIFVKQVQQNPYATVSSDYVVRWSNQVMLWLSMAIFILTLKLLRLIRFNPHICQMQGTLKRSARPVLSFAFVFAVVVVAFSFFGFVGFGSQVAIFSSLDQSFRTNLLMSIGKQFDYGEMREFNSTLEMLYFFCYFLFILAVLVNIFIAVLVDSYADVRKKQEEDFADAKLGDFMFGRVVEKIHQFRPGKFVTRVKKALCSKSVKKNYKPNLKFERRRKRRQVSKVERNTLKLSSEVFIEVHDEAIVTNELVPLKLPADSSNRPRDEHWRTEAEKTIRLTELFETYYLIQARKSLAEIAAELRRSLR